MLGAALLLAACGSDPFEDHHHDSCQCDVDGYATAGTVSLTARDANADEDAGYLAAVVSFEKASTDVAVTHNDWDLLYGNDKEANADYFTVNTVVDDQSFIVDLGAIDFRAVPETVDPATIDNVRRDPSRTGVGQYDEVKVVEGHVYYVRTKDDDTTQVAVFGVKKHTLNQSVELAWFRSSDKDRFVFAWP